MYKAVQDDSRWAGRGNTTDVPGESGGFQSCLWPKKLSKFREHSILSTTNCSEEEWPLAQEHLLMHDIVSGHGERMQNLKRYYPFFRRSAIIHIRSSLRMCKHSGEEYKIV